MAVHNGQGFEMELAGQDNLRLEETEFEISADCDNMEALYCIFLLFDIGV